MRFTNVTAEAAKLVTWVFGVILFVAILVVSSHFQIPLM